MSTSPRIRVAPHAGPPGYTLWELTMVLLVMGIAATLAAPAFARLGSGQQQTGNGAPLLALLHDARKAAVDHNATATLRLDPKTLKYELDTTTVGGFGTMAAGHLDMGLSETLVSSQPRLQYVFRPTGAAFADTVAVRGASTPLVIRVDAWSGVARADSR
jgi:prepilin-type N-terminal cleavage/methylation domain-containing protein